MNTATILLCGDVMTGRGIDQILAHPGSPRLHEAGCHDARHYVELAELAHGWIPRRVSPAFIWGEALAVIDRMQPAARIANLETAVTRSDEPWPDKEVHYRMHPANVSCLTAAGLDVVTLANNHVLDWGRAGLVETLDTLAAAGIRTIGAGRTAAEAARPAIVPLADGGRVLVIGIGSETSGIPTAWRAGPGLPGVHLVADLSPASAAGVCDGIGSIREPGDIVVVSIHQGSNWGFVVEEGFVAFAHALVDGGVDIVHGHSSHHMRPIEIYRDRPILYGCGECIDDYEGITGCVSYRSDLVGLVFATVERATGRLLGLSLVPMQIRGMQVRRARPADAAWLAATLEQMSAPFGTTVRGRDGRIDVVNDRPRWALHNHPSLPARVDNAL